MKNAGKPVDQMTNEELEAIAFSDIRDFFNEDGSPRAYHSLPDTARMAVAELTVNESPDGSKSFHLKLHDKVSALGELLNRIDRARKAT